MSEQMLFDKQSGNWLRVEPMLYGGFAVISDEKQPEPKPEPTRAEVWITGPIRNADAGDDPGVSDEDFIDALSKTGCVDELHVYIDSVGGHTRALTKMMDALSRHPAKWKVCHLIGKGYSAAGALFLIGDERLMTPGSCLMLHDVHQAGDTTPEQCVSYSDAICDLYAAQSFDLDRATIREWQHRETWIDAATAIRLGWATGLDTRTPERTTLDASQCNQPKPPENFPATRAFNELLAAKSKPKPSTPVPDRGAGNPNRHHDDPEWEQVQIRQAVRAKGLIPITIPPMPATLRGKCFASVNDVHGIVDQHNASVTAGPENALEQYHAHQSERFLKTIRRIQLHGAYSPFC